ncbi:MAG: tRNA lysidine(34) synthetase TilS, partial [Candidatus Dojkabacteria bacterium]|nr:tRNA lysidine(34) synthetase TilS [Candidatus Dojkabacteria bacterium]
FCEVLSEKQASAVVLAHHLDDQVETLFLKLMRGSGIRGLRSMTFTSKSPYDGKTIIVRPLLNVTREEIREYLKSLGLTNENNIDWIDDPTNDDPEYCDRNYIRHNIVPLFKRRWSNFYDSVRNTINSLNDDFVALNHELQPRRSIGLGYLLSKPDECIYSYIMNVYSSWGNKRPTRKQVIEFVKQLRQKNINSINPQLLVGNLRLRKDKNVIMAERTDKKELKERKSRNTNRRNRMSQKSSNTALVM